MGNAPSRGLWLVTALTAFSCSSDKSSESIAVPPTSSAQTPSLPDPARCAALKQSYVDAQGGASKQCATDSDCGLEARGKLFTGLDGCSRSYNRQIGTAKADAFANDWLAAGCASTYILCPDLATTPRCTAGVCGERPPSPIAADWVRVDMEEALTVFLPPDLVETRIVRECGNGPAMRAFHGLGLDVRVEYGYELSYLPIQGHTDETPYPVRSVTRRTKPIRPYESTLLTFEEPDISSKKTMPDGTWPSYHFVRALSVEGMDAKLRSGFLGLGQGVGPVSMAIIIEGDRARDPIASNILDTVSFW